MFLLLRYVVAHWLPVLLSALEFIRGEGHLLVQGQLVEDGEEHLLGEPSGDLVSRLVLEMPSLVQPAHKKPSCRLLRADHSLKWVMKNVSE